ncbi:hypothetical protein FCG40_03110 [Fimbriimonadia bacterium ATM]|nr:MAG: hypothetical protein EDM73_05240 [Armatimonadota bacterium]MBC6969271.1 hypothetical protein [Armatimonadota bacterium]MCE7899390.1 hypothetical protein [Armatimonadetes bacterium ATM1]MDL1927965.1 hypothetical protein [Fimbriimonadia bacterium ATM]RIJ97443.1 MAG: hypothetical protein DCC45_05300 [Armatimonadota bacterium]
MSTGRSSTASGNRTLAQAKRAKQDEFYTQLADIENELKHYRDHFRGKVVLCNCDDPFESNFFKYFAANFNALGLKKLVCTSYDGSPIAGQGVLFAEYHEGNGKRQKPKAVVVTLEQVKDETGDGAATLHDVELFLKRNKAVRRALKADDQYPGGDFRSKECVEILKTADIVVTNPPFSLFREYVAQLVEHGKQFLIIGNVNAITYKEVFKLVKENKIWMGPSIHSGDREFRVPDYYPLEAAGFRVDANGVKYIRVKGVRWFTNMDHAKRHEFIPLFKRYSPEAYPKYDNYDAINVNRVADIPVDYDGAMGVPVTFLDKYNPEQFRILGITDRDNNSGLKSRTYTEADVPNPGDLNRRGVVSVDGELKSTYARLLIKRKKMGVPAIQEPPI